MAQPQVLADMRDAVRSGNARRNIDEHRVRSNRRPAGDMLRQVAIDIDREATATSAPTPEEEAAIGEAIHQRLGQQMQILNAPRAERALTLLAEPVVRQTHRSGVQYRFYVIASDTLNAFSHAGGYVYITTGLLKFLKKDAEVQFVLGHEVAHIELGHVIRQWAHMKRAAQILGEQGPGMAAAVYQIFSAGYSQENEFECDQWSYRALAGRRPPEGRAAEADRNACANTLPTNSPPSGPNPARSPAPLRRRLAGTSARTRCGWSAYGGSRPKPERNGAAWSLCPRGTACVCSPKRSPKRLRWIRCGPSA